MRDPVLLFTNANYLDHPGRYPDAQARLATINREVARSRRQLQTIGLHFRADDTGNALDAIVEQIRASLRDVLPGATTISLFGDGGNGAFLRAKQLLEEDVPERKTDRLFLAPGGTMNLIAQALGVRLEHVRDFLASRNGFTKEVMVRELVLHMANGRQVTYPWVAFAGVDFAARILMHYDKQPRSNHVLTNVLLAALELAPDVVFDDGQYTLDLATAVSQLGLIRFSPERFNLLHASDFSRFQLVVDSGGEAAVKAIALQLAGIDPIISEFYWTQPELARLFDRLPGHDRWRNLLEAMRPRRGSEPHTSHPIGPNSRLHTDGYPRPLPPAVTDYSYRTIAKPGVRVYARTNI